MRPAPCHPTRPHAARGLCKTCYDTDRRRRWRDKHWRRPCAICSRSYVPLRLGGLYCSKACQRFETGLRQSRRAGHDIDSYLTTNDGDTAARLVLVLRGRGLRRVGPRTPRSRAAMRGPYYSAWRRPTADGHHLFVVRWWSDDEAREEAA